MKGVNPAWANLPRRKCDDCGKNYKPKQPLREGQRGFCKDTCRKSYHKHGGAYRKLKAEMQKMVSRHLAEINEASQTELRILCNAAFTAMRRDIELLLQGHYTTYPNAAALPAKAVSPLPNPQRRA